MAAIEIIKHDYDAATDMSPQMPDNTIFNYEEPDSTVHSASCCDIFLGMIEIGLVVFPLNPCGPGGGSGGSASAGGYAY